MENLANYGITIANKSIIKDKHNETNQKLLQ